MFKLSEKNIVDRAVRKCEYFRFAPQSNVKENEQPVSTYHEKSQKKPADKTFLELLLLVKPGG